MQDFHLREMVIVTYKYHHYCDPDQHHLCSDSPVCVMLRGRVLGWMWL